MGFVGVVSIKLGCFVIRIFMVFLRSMFRMVNFKYIFGGMPDIMGINKRCWGRAK